MGGCCTLAVAIGSGGYLEICKDADVGIWWLTGCGGCGEKGGHWAAGPSQTEESHGTEGVRGSGLPGRGHAETHTTWRVSGVTCAANLLDAHHTPFLSFPSSQASFLAHLQSGCVKLWPKKGKWKLMYTTFRRGLFKAVLQDRSWEEDLNSFSFLGFFYIMPGNTDGKWRERGRRG